MQDGENTLEELTFANLGAFERSYLHKAAEDRVIVPLWILVGFAYGRGYLKPLKPCISILGDHLSRC